MKGGKTNPGLPPNCMCGYEFKNDTELCPRCWPDKQPKVEQLSLKLGDY